MAASKKSPRKAKIATASNKRNGTKHPSQKKRETPAAARLKKAAAEWQKLLGEKGVISDTTAYAENLAGVNQEITLVLKPSSADLVPEIVKIAGKHRIPLYPMSCGRNWGYGTRNPVKAGEVVLDLSALNRIIEVNTKYNWIRLEPGVTQMQLYDHLKRNRLYYIVPTTGAGPYASILGNLLERGYGITPHTDHFKAMLALKAVLPDGSVYRSPLLEIGNDLGNSFKWGLGPYMDGLFSQGNFGIVTEATIELHPMPEKAESFFFRIWKRDNLADVVEAVRELRSTLGTNISGINLMNDRRLLSMSVSYPTEELGADGILPQETVDKLCKKNKLGFWGGVGTIYGPKSIAKQAKRMIKRKLAGKVSTLVFLDLKDASRLRSIGKVLSRIGAGNLGNFLQKLYKGIEIMAGIPNDTALPLVFWEKDEGGEKDYSKLESTSAGVIWYSPLVPKDPALVKDFEQMVFRICREYGIEPLITLTSITERIFDSTIPLLFDKTDADATTRARACYEMLLEEGKRLGVYPYRFAVDHMNKSAFTGTPRSSFLSKLQKAADPKGIISPGRYCPVYQKKTRSNNCP